MHRLLLKISTKVLLCVMMFTTTFFGAPASITDAATQSAYRWRNDDGTEATATFAAAQNTTIAIPKGTGKRLRFGATNSGSEEELLARARTLGKELNLKGGVIDVAGGHAYFGVESSGLPAQVVKIRLSDFTRVGAIPMVEGEDGISTGVIDAVNGYAYFGTCPSGTTRVIKIDLATFSRVGAVDMTGSENCLNASVIDAAAGYAYFATSDSPSKIVKIDLKTFSHAGSLTLSSGEDGVNSAVIDTAAGFAYFGTGTAPGIVVKVNLGSFTRVGGLTLNSGEDFLYSAVIDTAAGFAYFGTVTSPGIVVKVGLSGFTRVGALTFGSGEDFLYSAVIDAANGFAYFGTATSPGIVVKVGLSGLTEAASLTLNSGENGLRAAAIDTAAGRAYFGTYTDPGNVVKVNVASLARVGAVTLETTPVIASAVVDVANGFAYYGTDTSPGQVIKVDLSNGSRVGTLTLNSGEDYLVSAVIDEPRGFAYFGLGTSSNGKVIKVDLSSFTRVGALALDTLEEYNLRTAVIDVSGSTHYAYFGTYYGGYSRIVKVDLDTFTRVGFIQTTVSHEFLGSAVIDTAAGFAYFAADTIPGRVLRVNLSNFTLGATTSLALNSGENFLKSAVIDTDNGFAYFGTDTSPGRVVKVNLSSFTRTGAVTLNSGENNPQAAVFDPVNDYAYFGTTDFIVVKIDTTDFTRDSALTVGFSGVADFKPGVIDTRRGFAYFGNNTNPSMVTKFSIAPHASFRLEQGLKTSTCAAIASWSQVVSTATNQAWEMAPSANITNGAVTTDSSGLTNGNTAFNPGRIQDTVQQTAEIAFGRNEFTEVEFSVRPTTNAVTDGNYCFRLTDAGSATGFSFTNYGEATATASGSNNPTTSNRISMSRLKIGTASTVGINFTLSGTLSGALTVTFPVGFTVTSAATGPASSGCLSGFGFTSTTLTATKTNCSGAITLGGATVTNPGTPGIYTVSWVNDDPGSGQVVIVDDDQVTVSAAVAANLVFDLDVGSATGTNSSAPYTVALGALTTGAVATSGSGGVNMIGIDLETNAAGGAVVAVRSANAALASLSVPADIIPAVSSTTLAAGTAGYGICVHRLASGPASTVRSAGFHAGGTLSASNAATTSTTCTAAQHQLTSGLTTSAQNIIDTNGAPAQAGRAEVFVKAAISPTTPAHDDYADALTFIATSTF